MTTGGGRSGPAARPTVTRMVNSSRRIVSSAALSLFGAGAIGLVTVDLLNPQWDPVEVMASHYVNGRAGGLIPASLTAIGIGSALITAIVWPARTGRWLLASWCTAVLVAAALPADPPGNWDQPMSLAAMVHGVAGMVAFLVLPVAAILLARRRSGLASRPVRLGAAVLAVVGIGHWVTFLDVLDGPSLIIGGHSVVGLTERVLIFAGLGWLAALAISVRRNAGPHRPDAVALRRDAVRS